MLEERILRQVNFLRDILQKTDIGKRKLLEKMKKAYLRMKFQSPLERRND